MPRIFPIRFSTSLRQALIHLGLSLVLGFAWYLLLYNRFPLYPSHVNWIYNAGGDMLQHQLGWEWFRQEPWRFPLGGITAYGYPFGTSITFMDSIPLLAIPFKLLSPWLEADFQYFGWWELASVIGQALAGLLILHEFTRSYALKLLGASMLVISPPLILRAFYHNSLSAQWIILAGIWFVLLEYRQRLWRGAWIMLFALVTWVHVYYIPMLIPFWLIGLLFHYRRDLRRWRIILEITAVTVVVFLAGYSIGLFNMGYQSLVQSGFGFFSWNLNGLFNPHHLTSAYIKQLPTGTDGQYEGFSYLGLGNLLLLPPALYLFLLKDCTRRRLHFLLPFGVAAAVFVLFALSNKAFAGGLPLWDIPLSDPLLAFLNLFRASGRFILPVFYLVVLLGLVSIIRHVRFATAVLLLATILQTADLQSLFGAKRMTGFTAYTSPLQSEVWQAVAESNRHMVVIPAEKLTADYEPLAIYAVRHHLTLNLGYFARSDRQAFAAYAAQVWEALKAGRADADTVYILSSPEWVAYARASLADRLLICELDGFDVLLAPENPLLKVTNLTSYCSIP